MDNLKPQWSVPTASGMDSEWKAEVANALDRKEILKQALLNRHSQVWMSWIVPGRPRQGTKWPALAAERSMPQGSPIFQSNVVWSPATAGRSFAGGRRS